MRGGDGGKATEAVRASKSVEWDYWGVNIGNTVRRRENDAR